MLSEWCAELAREFGERGGWPVVAASLGAFSDARALRALDRATHRGERRADGRHHLWASGLRVSARGLLRTPGFTAISVFTLAIGLGSSSAIYTLLDRIVLAPLPYPGAERLVRLANVVPGVDPDAVWALSTAQLVYFSDNAQTLDDLGIYQGSGTNVMTPSGPERARSVRVTASVLPMLGARVRLGRLITESDDQPRATRVALVSHAFWSTTLGGDPDAVGLTVSLDGQPTEIIGVLEPALDLPGWPRSEAPDLWLPLRIDRAGSFGNSHVYPAIGRLVEGSSPEAVEAELAQLTTRLPEAFPTAYGQSFFDRYGFRTIVRPLRSDVIGTTAATLWILFGGVGLVLLVACANVANLFLVRVESRRRELSLRRALGADRAAIARYVLSDALVLSVMGGLLGLAVGVWAIPTLTRLAPEGLPRLDGVTLGLNTIVFTSVASLAVSIVISIYPLTSSTASVRDLVAGGRGSSAGPERQKLRAALVVSQMSLAVALLVGAGLLVESLSTLRAKDPGFEAEGVVAVDVYASSLRYPTDVSLWLFHREILSRVRGLPGVTAAGMGEEVPVAGGYGCTVQGFEDTSVYGRIEAAGLTTCAGQQRVTPGYFEALGIPLVAGRYLEDGDNDDPTRAAVVVSRTFADRFWPGEDPLGQGVGPGGRTEPPFFHVVGVVGDVARRADGGQPPLSQTAIAVYYPGVYNPDAPTWGGWWPGTMTLVAKAGDDFDAAVSLLPAIRDIVSEIDPEAPLANAVSMRRVVDSATAEVSFLSSLMLIAAGAALLLAAVGLYGVVSWAVSRRSREIGMRLAIGADPVAVVRAVMGQTTSLAGFGLVLGLPLAFLTSRVARAVLVGIDPTAPKAYLGAAAAVAMVSFFAAWLPARRAAAIDPAESLRAE
jgi:putative ABC transport system permease protein